MQEVHTNIIKSKFVGFRLAYSDWMRLMQLTSSMNLSITDFMHSLILPVLNQYPLLGTNFKPENNSVQYPEMKKDIPVNTKPRTTVNEKSLPEKKLFNDDILLTELKLKHNLWTTIPKS